jgi:hypothetical protein
MLLRLLFMGAVACFLAGTRARADVTLVQDGEARATIHAPAEVLELQDRHLAALKNPERDAEAWQLAPLRDLARYLEKMCLCYVWCG